MCVLNPSVHPPAPCQPTGLVAHVDCGTNRTNLSWAESAGASYYVAEVTGEHGHVTTCQSNETLCLVMLDCGRTYNATLVAASGSCNSSLHDTIQFDSGKAQAINTLFNDPTASDIIHTHSSLSSP